MAVAAGRQEAARLAREVSLDEARARAEVPVFLKVLEALRYPPPWVWPSELWELLAVWANANYIEFRSWWRHLMWSLPIPDWWLPEREFVPLIDPDAKPLSGRSLRLAVNRMLDLKDEYNYERQKLKKLRAEREERRKLKWRVFEAKRKYGMNEEWLRAMANTHVEQQLSRVPLPWNEEHRQLHVWDHEPIRWMSNEEEYHPGFYETDSLHRLFDTVKYQKKAREAAEKAAKAKAAEAKAEKEEKEKEDDDAAAEAVQDAAKSVVSGAATGTAPGLPVLSKFLQQEMEVRRMDRAKMEMPGTVDVPYKLERPVVRTHKPHDDATIWGFYVDPEERHRGSRGPDVASVPPPVIPVPEELDAVVPASSVFPSAVSPPSSTDTGATSTPAATAPEVVPKFFAFSFEHLPPAISWRLRMHAGLFRDHLAEEEAKKARRKPPILKIEDLRGNRTHRRFYPISNAKLEQLIAPVDFFYDKATPAMKEEFWANLPPEQRDDEILEDYYGRLMHEWIMVPAQRRMMIKELRRWHRKKKPEQPDVSDDEEDAPEARAARAGAEIQRRLDEVDPITKYPLLYERLRNDKKRADAAYYDQEGENEHDKLRKRYVLPDPHDGESDDEDYDSGDENDPLLYEGLQKPVKSLMDGRIGIKLLHIVQAISMFNSFRVFVVGGIFVYLFAEPASRFLQDVYNFFFWEPPPPRMMY